MVERERIVRVAIARRRRLAAALLVVAAAAGCRDDAAARGGGSAGGVGSSAGTVSAGCPAGFGEDEGRARALVERLRRDEEGARLLAGARSWRACFGRIATSVVTPEGVLLLDNGQDEAAMAARTGHLLLHVAERTALDPPGDASCETWVDAALASEARAIALELRLRRSFGAAGPSGYEFEAAYFDAAPAAREALVLRYLREHPEGAPGVDGLASGYAARCRALKSSGAGGRAGRR